MTEWRFIAQRATTKEYLDLDVPLKREELKWELSGAGALRGTVSPDVGTMRAPDGRLLLEEWGTLIYAEADGQIRWGGIVISSKFDGPTWSVEAAGFTSYLHGLAYAGDYSKVGLDPVDAVKEIWRHVQAYPDGDLGLVVTGDKTPVRLGVPPEKKSFTTGAGENVSFQTGPYTLNWWSNQDCGGELESLAKETPFDFAERHYWSGDEIKHELQIGYPRLGRRRTDLAFIQGDNVSRVVTPTIDGDDFANEVLGLGAGEGKGAVHRTTARRDGRLRRSYVYTAKDVTSTARMDALIRDQLQRRSLSLDIQSVTVRDHPNARLGSWQVGDDVLIQATVPWLGDVELWCRIVGWTLLSEHTATLSLKRSDAFTYGG
ncbi:minor tail protein [Arthrobacter phage MaGuCo]|uniref:Minor tail protein n=1 Tax=Arthrobacter phage MaGuCo TaxID=3038363 RepID=A0AAF0GGY4_9CAUD|nr:minor tail protein [Arthrobacter phage MaGuCo]